MPTIDNEEIKDWYERENARDEARDIQTLLLTIAFAAQMVYYYNLWDDAVTKRDAVLDRQKEFLDYLYDKDMTVDYPMMLLKQDVLDLEVPTPDMCGDARLWEGCTLGVGVAIDKKAESQAGYACGGMPSGWTFGEGELLAKRAAAYAGGMLSHSAKRREEQFRVEKTKLVLRAQATARMQPGLILKDYNQAATIQEGLAQIFAAGFQSAGLGLGVNLQRLATPSVGSG